MIVPIVLAAGASRRMGRIKALCDFDGRTCLELVMAACADGGAAAPIVVLGPEGDAIAARVDLSGATVVRNVDREQGQTSSLLVGLRALPDAATAFLIFPVDYPLVTAAYVRQLMDAFARASAAGPAPRVVAFSYQGRRGHPILLHRDLAQPLLALPPDGSARDVIREYDASTFYMVTENPAIASDMDTPDDYQRLLSIYRNRGA